MTYCLAIKVDQGLVFAADSRTSASVDDVRSYTKMHVYEIPGKAVFTLLSAGNLATSQSVREHIQRDLDAPKTKESLARFRHMFDAAQYIGGLSVRAQKSIAEHGLKENVNLKATFILGGQIGNEEPAIYLIYPQGNFIESSPGTPFLQIGETKYGKPILDRIVRAGTSLENAARCALVSLDSSMRSNLSVGPPLDLLIYRRNDLRVSYQERMDFDTPYYNNLKEAWGRELEAAFSRLPAFEWEMKEEQNQQGPRLVSGNQYQQGNREE